MEGALQVANLVHTCGAADGAERHLGPGHCDITCLAFQNVGERRLYLLERASQLPILLGHLPVDSWRLHHKAGLLPLELTLGLLLLGRRRAVIAKALQVLLRRRRRLLKVLADEGEDGLASPIGQQRTWVRRDALLGVGDRGVDGV